MDGGGPDVRHDRGSVRLYTSDLGDTCGCGISGVEPVWLN